MDCEKTFRVIIKAIKSTSLECSTISFENVSDADAETIYDSLYHPINNLESRHFRYNFNSLTKTLTVKMPSEIHEVGLGWMFSFCSWRESMPPSSETDIEVLASPKFDKFDPPYQNSIKEPDGLFRVFGSNFPSVVLEVGWSETWTKLKLDRDLWLNGSGGVAPVVILINFTKTSRGVKGVVELASRRNSEQVIQSKPIWPVPSAGTEDPFILLGELYGSHLPAEYDPSTKLYFKMSVLRSRGERRLTELSLSACA